MILAPHPYGSDKDGLICGFLFQPGQTGQPINLAGAKDWLKRRSSADSDPAASGFVWLHFNLSDAKAEDWIKTNLPVVPEFFEALHTGTRSTRIEDAADNLVAVVNDVTFDFTFDPSEIGTLWVNVGPELAVSARLHPLKSIDQLRHSVMAGKTFNSSVAFLNQLMHDQGDVLVRIVREATLKVDELEDAWLAGRWHKKRMDLGNMRRLLVRLRRLLAPEPAALFRLLRNPPQWVQEEDLEELRQATEEFSLVIQDGSELQERIKLLQEEVAALVNEQTNKSVFTLTIVTVLALPVNMVAGLFGMNVGGIPLADHPYGFFWVLGTLIAFTLLASWLVWRRTD
jgi:zinc transporter